MNFSNKPFYVNFIGPDGCGKDTAFNRLIQEEFPDVIQLREPGGSPESEVIRDILLNPAYKRKEMISLLDDLIQNTQVVQNCKHYLQNAKELISESGLTGYAEVELFAASRAQTNQTIVIPSKENGISVMGRRSVACSMAYQGKARGLGMDYVWTKNLPAIEGAFPDFEIYFDVPLEVTLERLSGRTEKQDRLDSEKADFHRLSIEGYKEYYKNYCPYEYFFVDATKSIEEVYQQVKQILLEKVK